MRYWLLWWYRYGLLLFSIYMFFLVLWHMNTGLWDRPQGHWFLDLFLPVGVPEAIHNFVLVSWGAVLYQPDLTPLHTWVVEIVSNNLRFMPPAAAINFMNLCFVIILVLIGRQLQKELEQQEKSRK